jgi:hypothetical protein
VRLSLSLHFLLVSLFSFYAICLFLVFLSMCDALSLSVRMCFDGIPLCCSVGSFRGGYS